MIGFRGVAVRSRAEAQCVWKRVGGAGATGVGRRLGRMLVLRQEREDEVGVKMRTVDEKEAREQSRGMFAPSRRAGATSKFKMDSSTFVRPHKTAGVRRGVQSVSPSYPQVQNGF